MSATLPFTHSGQRSAFIRDDFLILYFETAETPLVSRFDLKTLGQANFEVIKQGESFALVLREFKGQPQTITVFASKVDAHQALHAILQALLSYGEHHSQTVKKSGWFKRLLKWIAILAAVLLVTYGVLLWLATPVTQVQDQTASSASSVPEGEPVDLEQLFGTKTVAPQTEQVEQSEPVAEETQPNRTDDSSSPDEEVVQDN